VPEETLEYLSERIEEVTDFAREYALGTLDPISRALVAYHGVYPTVPLQRTEAFWQRWDELYMGEFEDRAAGVAGVITSRAATQVLRLAVVYALAAKTDTVDVSHLEAALAVWRYCSESVSAIFGTVTGSRDADRYLDPVQAQQECQAAGRDHRIGDGHEAGGALPGGDGDTST
jgi:hypothetical protein